MSDDRIANIVTILGPAIWCVSLAIVGWSWIFPSVTN